MRIRKYLNKNGQGYTMIEILVVVGILGIIATMGSNMFFSILKGSAKTQILNQIKQNGDYALEVMERTIRGAATVVVTVDGDFLTVTNLGGDNIIFSCEEIGGERKIASGGASLIGETVKVAGNCQDVFGVTPGIEGARPTVVQIDFKLTQVADTPRPEETAEMDFRTSVTLRNY